MFQPRPWTYPDVEMLAAVYLRRRHSGTYVSRTSPKSLPITVAGVTYTEAIIVRDDSGTSRDPVADRRLGVRVQGSDPKAFAAARSLAEAVAASLRVWALTSPEVVAVGIVRGPWATSDADAPPEFYLTAEVTLFGSIATE